MTSTTTSPAATEARFGSKTVRETPSTTLRKEAKVKPFSKKVLVDLFRGLGSMLRAQINTADALKYYSNDLPDKVLSGTLLQIREDIAKGMNVHEAFRRTGRFNDTIVGLIQAGSDAGQLHHAFNSLAARLKSELHFSKQLKKATVTPCVIICVLVG
ncbi:MAG: type II secretion system F family protein, partial [Verrucomicrobiota bacterium]